MSCKDLLKKYEEDEDLLMQLIIMANRTGKIDELEKKYSLPFSEIVEDGLGKCFSTFIQLEEVKLWLRCYGECKTDESGIIFDIRSFEKSPQKSCDRLFVLAVLF